MIDIDDFCEQLHYSYIAKSNFPEHSHSSQFIVMQNKNVHAIEIE